MWNDFKSRFIVECLNNKARVRWDIKHLTVSEGIGYGMLMAVSYGDKDTFNKLWRFYKHFLNEHNLMHWKVAEEGVIEKNAATDSDEDCAIALVMAHNKWISSEEFVYEKEAKDLIKAIKEFEIEKNTYIVKPGDMWGGGSITNISYFAPAYYKIFGEFTNDEEFWSKVVDKCYEIIKFNQVINKSKGGLVSDWCNASGNKVSKSYVHGYDATRTLWRIAIDYLWFNDLRAKSYCEKNNEWMTSQGFPEGIKDGYSLEGKPLSARQSITFIASFAMTTILDEKLKQKFISKIKTVNPCNYFDWCFLLLSDLFLSDRFKI